MSVTYFVGVVMAILAGSMNAVGAILQKSAINRIEARAQKGSFTASFVRDPVWIAGLALSIGLGTVFNFGAQSRIGPALVPALTASGMIILAFGSARLLNERLKPAEWLGIFSLIAGIGFLGYSGLQIPSAEVNLLDGGLRARIFIFSAALLLAWVLSWLVAQKDHSLIKGLLLAVSAGFAFCLSNLWILPLLITIGPVLGGRGRPVEILLFVLASLILTLTNMLAIRQTQEAYRYAPANKCQPVQAVPTQIVPILIYLLVFQRAIGPIAVLLVPVGVMLVLAGGFLLGQRRLEREAGTPVQAGVSP